MRIRIWWGLILSALPVAAAEHTFDFSNCREGQTPTGFRSTLTGQGKPGIWQVLFDKVTPLLAPLTPQALATKRPVLAQLSQDPTDDRYPLLIYQDETYRDFTLTTRFKLVSGTNEQMAGLAFRIQDEKNYYYVRASGLGRTFYFFKFVNGALIGPIGSKVEIAKDAWHEIKVECRGSQVSCSLDGNNLTTQMQHDNFAKGKIGFWTKSDSVSYFTDTKIVYAPLENPGQKIVRELAKKYPRLLGLKIYVAGQEPTTMRLIASKDEQELGQPGGKTEQQVLSRGETYYGKEKEAVSVIMPLRDRNGEPLAAVRVVMKTFPGQTEQNAIIRAAPIVKEIQERVRSLEDLAE